MENEHFKIIEINGIKMQVDLRNAKVIDEYKVGDNIKVLIQDYSDNYKSYIGTIIGFDDFEKTPTVVVAYLKTEYSSATIEFLYYNRQTKNAEIAALNDWDLPLTKSQVLDNFHREQLKKEQELKELQQKERMFEKLFGKYFEKEPAKA
jgi:hypothetical protein